MKETTVDLKKISESFRKFLTNTEPKITKKKIRSSSKWFTDY